MSRLPRPTLAPQSGPEPGIAAGDPLEPCRSPRLIECLAEGMGPARRWHRHAACELHIVVGATGLAFVGDWIGPFGPGQVVLTGPHLPHRWLALDEPVGVMGTEGAGRRLVLRFAHEPLVAAVRHLPELAELTALLERARQGILFFGMDHRVAMHVRRIQERRGLLRLAAFCGLMADLGACADQRMLSRRPVGGNAHSDAFEQIDSTLLAPADRMLQPITAAHCAAELGMSPSRFSRFFRHHTGRTFTDFVAQARIHRGCQLLAHSDKPVEQIGKEVGIHRAARFDRRFLEIMGATPGEYRKQAGRGAE